MSFLSIYLFIYLFIALITYLSLYLKPFSMYAYCTFTSLFSIFIPLNIAKHFHKYILNDHFIYYTYMYIIYGVQSKAIYLFIHISFQFFNVKNKIQKHLLLNTEHLYNQLLHRLTMSVHPLLSVRCQSSVAWAASIDRFFPFFFYFI